jgi:hypothetical protein
MSINLADLQNLVNVAMETGPDMTEVQAGGGARKELPVGPCLGYLVGYVERGAQPQYHQGKLKEGRGAYQDEVQLSLALYGEGIENADGTPYIEHLYPFANSRTTKSNAYKNFATMNWQNNKTHWIQMVGSGFLFEVVKKKSETTGKEYTCIDLSKTRPPLDPLTKRPYPMPEFPEKALRVFLFDAPQLAHWELLPEFTQNDILGANNFAGSALEQMLLTAGKNTKHKPREQKAATGAAKASESGAAGPDSGAAGPDGNTPTAEQLAALNRVLSAEDAQRVADAPFEGGTVVSPAMPGMDDA